MIIIGINPVKIVGSPSVTDMLGKVYIIVRSKK
jgi:hypothetical protein